MQPEQTGKKRQRNRDGDGTLRSGRRFDAQHNRRQAVTQAMGDDERDVMYRRKRTWLPASDGLRVDHEEMSASFDADEDDGLASWFDKASLKRWAETQHGSVLGLTPGLSFDEDVEVLRAWLEPVVGEDAELLIAVLVLDEVQSGYGRSGDFFAHQRSGIMPDLITVAKGMGNGFPIGGVLVHPTFQATHGLLGTTFGGNHLACAAAIAVLEIIRDGQLLADDNVHQGLKTMFAARLEFRPARAFHDGMKPLVRGDQRIDGRVELRGGGDAMRFGHGFGACKLAP